MFTFPIGALLIVAVIVSTLFGMDLAKLVNLEAIILVIGGTFAIMVISNPYRHLYGLYKAFIGIWKKDYSSVEIDKALISLCSDRYAKINLKHPLIQFAQGLWEQGVEKDIFKSLLAQKLDDFNGQSEKVVTVLKNLAKYPPSLGMTGTVVGLVALFSNLGGSNKDSIGPALAVAVVATFYGLILTNFIILPVSDRLHIIHLSRAKRNEQIYLTLVLINSGEPVDIIKNNQRKKAS